MTTESAIPALEGQRRHLPGEERGTGAIKLFLKKLGPGLITGASDDDPSGIATYSQIGAKFGYGLLWTMLLSYPLMAAIQEISARIGRVTGCGIAANLRKSYPKPVLYSVLVVMSIANVFNLGADIGAMGAALKLLFPGNIGIFTVTCGVVSLLAVVFIPYSTYVKYLKWLTMSLFAYVGVVFFVHVSWSVVLHASLIPQIALTKGYLTALIAVLGTTISPYLFFWQASQEVEEVKKNRGEKSLKRAPIQAKQQLSRIRIDTYTGMAFSNLVAFFIILTAASTLHVHGVTEIASSAQAASALEPLAGRFAFVLFVCGIVGTGLLAIPVLAASAAYGIGEACRWEISLERTPARAPILWRRVGGNPCWALPEFLAHRSDESSVLGGNPERSGCSTTEGGDHDDGLKSTSNGEVCHSYLSEKHGLGCNRVNVVRLPRRVFYIIKFTKASQLLCR